MFEVWSPRRIRGPPRYVATADGNSPPDGTSQVALVVKNPLSNAGDIRDVDSIPGLGRSPGGGQGNPLQYFACRILWTEELGGLQSMGLQRVRHN